MKDTGCQRPPQKYGSYPSPYPTFNRSTTHYFSSFFIETDEDEEDMSLCFVFILWVSHMCLLPAPAWRGRMWEPRPGMMLK